MKKYLIDGKGLTCDFVYDYSIHGHNKYKLEISSPSLEAMKRSRDYVLKIIKLGKPVYGINTGFGALAHKRIDDKDLETLQYNLIRSHCTGVGEAFNPQLTRTILLLRASCLARGNSGVNPEIVQLLLDFLNHDILPVIPEKGSVGASGDLAPLAHLSLSLIGEGEVLYEGQTRPSHEVMKTLGLEPAKLGPKDGLALINGTAVMAALGAVCLGQSKALSKVADIAAAVSNEATRGTTAAYNMNIHHLKPHPGQIESANNLNHILLENKLSEIQSSHLDCDKVQDPYSLRCVPQVHGACRQTIKHLEDILIIEINAVTDNPLIFPEQDKVYSGGNFHGEAIAFAMDYLAIGLSEYCNISERRVEKMMNPVFSELPHFLIEDSGLNSGLMIAHVTSAALVSENKIMAHPASVDSIPTSTDKEDHVSMGVTSGRKLKVILDNLKSCLAIELLCNTQAIDLLKPLKSTKAINELLKEVRLHIPPITKDRVFAKDIAKLTELIENGTIVNKVESILGELK